MPIKLPIKAAAPRVKSPATRTRPSRLSAPSPTRQSSSSRRSRSQDHDRARRPSDASSTHHPHPSSSGRTRSRHRRSPSPTDRHERRRRRDSSSSPERYGSRRDDDHRNRDHKHQDDPDADTRRHRRLSAVERGDGGRPRRSSADYRSPSLRVGAAPGAFNHEGDNDPRNRDDHGRRRASTPDKYRPDKYKERQHSTSPRPAKTASKPAAASPPPLPAEVSSSGTSALFNNMPTAIAAYAGLKTISKQAETAKEWIDWFTELSDTPEEIQELSDKADVARDTIFQVQQLIKARPDLLEGDKQGEALQEQIEDAIENTNKALSRMTKLLAEISKKGGAADQGNMMKDFWRSYRYKEEFEEKIEKADADVQKELTGLSKLMLNLNTRALVKPAPTIAGMSAASTKAAPELVHKDEAIRSEQVPGPRPAGNNPESTQTKSKPAHKPLREGFKDGFREVLIIEGLRDRPETEDDKEDQKKGIPKSQESPRVAEELNPSTSTPSSLESRPNQNIDSATVSQSMGGHLPPSPSEVAKEEAAIGSPPILITEPTQTTTSSPSMSKEPSTAAAALDPDPPESPGHKRSEQSPEDDLLDAAWNGDMEAAIKALRYAPPGICDDHGMTPLHLSAERDRMPVSMLLLDRGASISARSDGGRTPLHLAARSATSPMVEMLLERGKANANAETSKGRTPLHYAASKASDGDEEKREVLRVLRDWGADPTIKDIDGETARDVAQKREHWDAAATLRRAEKRWEEDHKQNWLQRHGFKK